LLIMMKFVDAGSSESKLSAFTAVNKVISHAKVPISPSTR